MQSIHTWAIDWLKTQVDFVWPASNETKGGAPKMEEQIVEAMKSAAADREGIRHEIQLGLFSENSISLN